MKNIASVALADSVQRPGYDRQALRSRIVHFGFGTANRSGAERPGRRLGDLRDQPV